MAKTGIRLIRQTSLNFGEEIANLPFPGRLCEEGVYLFVRATPKAAKTRIGPIAADAAGQTFLKIYVTAPPEDGKANMAVIELLSKTLKIAKSHFRITAGQADRRKTILIDKKDVTVPYLTDYFG